MKSQTRNIYGFYYLSNDRMILDFIGSIIGCPIKQIEVDRIDFNNNESILVDHKTSYTINSQDVCIFIMGDGNSYESEYHDIYNFLSKNNSLENCIIYSRFKKKFFKLKNPSIFSSAIITKEDKDCNKEIIHLFLDLSNDIEIKIDHSPIAPSLDLIPEDIVYPALFNSNINPILNPLGISPDLIEFL